MNKYINPIIIVLLLGAVFLYLDTRPLNIEKTIRGYGFKGNIEIYKGTVPCNGVFPHTDSPDGCYNFDTNTIKINKQLSNKGLKRIILHEIKHWYCNEPDESLVDDCVLPDKEY